MRRNAISPSVAFKSSSAWIEHEKDLGRFVSEDARGKALRSEQSEAIGDLDRIARSVEHISYVVATQQSHTGPSSVLETTQPQELVEEALRMSADAIDRTCVTVIRRYADVPATALDKPRMLQILVNLIGNAAQAIERIPAPSRTLTLATALVFGESADARLRITVRDAGEGIKKENLTRIFAHGFTTREDGHGFGLHSSASAALEIGGRLTAHSDGPGRGAFFTLDVPLAAQAPPPAGTRPPH